MQKLYKEIQKDSDTWGVAQTISDGKPLFVRYREKIKEKIDYSKYPFQIGIAVPFLRPTSDGLVTNEEAQLLWEIEDNLEKLFSKNDVIFVLSITYNGMREFVFYSKEWKPEFFKQKINEIETSLSSKHELQFMMQEDKKWETFGKFSPQIK